VRELVLDMGFVLEQRGGVGGSENGEEDKELPEIRGIVSSIIICVGGCECRVERKRESVWVGDKEALER
jgi:hypothetical protein